MGRFSFLAVAVLTLVASRAAAGAPVVIRSQGWSITADRERAVLSIAQDNLGLLLEDVRINVEDVRGLSALTDWSLETSGQSVLTLHAAHPISAWTFEISHDTVKISTTLSTAVPVPGNAMIRLIPDYYTKVLGVPSYTPLDDSYFQTAPVVWSSWTAYYRDVTENDIVQNTDWLAKNLKPYGLQFIQLDDGYDQGTQGEHYWIENWNKEKFPHGPQWLTNYIKSKGLHAGLWLVPNAYAGAVDQHPDWYLRSKEDAIVHDYQTPAL
jgi:hypothetical protein